MTNFNYRTAEIAVEGDLFSVFENEAEKTKNFPKYCYMGGAASFALMFLGGNFAFGVFLSLFFVGIGVFIKKTSQKTRLVEINRQSGEIKVTHTDQGKVIETENLKLEPFDDIELAYWKMNKNLGENSSRNKTLYRVMLRREFNEDLMEEKAHHLGDAMKKSALAEKLVAATLAGAKSNYVSIGTETTTNREEAVRLAETLQQFLSTEKQVKIDERAHAALFPNVGGSSSGGISVGSQG